ncbi:proteinase-activated receptor 1-like [Xiphophorus hellerii]|uniref:proteinase-activated receptor 1-like n=1 Tax=Xiphophorus hellerii TaxID=8084 RepID=UPI0013B3B4D1|nr:proteinase-activated receptor 1-like [Xiphophorus hellerii]
MWAETKSLRESDKLQRNVGERRRTSGAIFLSIWSQDFTNMMFPGDLRSLVLVLVCLFSAAGAFEINGTNPRTFVIGMPNDNEPIDCVDEDHQLDCWSRLAPTIQTVRNKTLNGSLSEEARQFLTSPISTILMPSFYTLVCCISVPINLAAIVAFFKGIQPKKPAAIYMLNLASADLLFGLMLPFKISYHFMGNNWIFGWFLCRVVTASFYWNMYCSVLLIACISVDRFLAVVYPIDSLAWRKTENTIKACVTMWVLSFAASVPLVVSDQTAHVEELNVTTCHDVQTVEAILWLKIYFIAICFCLFVLPFLVTVGSYTKVIWTLSSVARGLQGRSRKKTRAVVMILTVLVIFVLCFMPTNCFLLAHYLLFEASNNASKATDSSYGLYLMFLCLGSLNCLLDPLLYYFGSSQCQRQLSNMLCRSSTKGTLTNSSSDSYRSSTRPILKSSRTECSTMTSSVSKTNSLEQNLNSQYKKLLV